MAWNISKAKRQALVKLQLRDKEGKFIEMGGGVKWYSSRLKKVVAGTVVGTKGENALVRLNKENPTHEPALVSVPAASITAIEGKASLPVKGEEAPSADQTPEFEKPEAVADVEADPNAEAESDHEDQLKGPQHLAANYGITETADGNTYITRKDGESIYSPARALKVGDELIAPAGADPTKPFSIGRGWATKGTERLNKEGEGPVIGKVIAISENRYAVVQMAGGHTIADRRSPEEQTDTVTVGLSNQVILATMGLKDALGDRVSSQTYADRPSDEEKEVAPDAPEAQSDHEGREVPEDQVEAESQSAPTDRAQVLRDMPVGGRIQTEDESQVFQKVASNQWQYVSGNNDLIKDSDVLGMVQRGEADGKKYQAFVPEDDENAPESAPEQQNEPEAQPAPESPVEEAPEAVEEAPETEAPVEDVPEESAGAKATPVNDIVEGLAELEQAAEDVDSSGISGEEADEVLDGATFKVTAADGKTYEVSTGADENGDWNFRVADENGAEVATHIIGSEENRVIAEKIAKGSAPAKKEETPAAEATSEAAPESTPEAPKAETYNENGLTEEEQRELTSYTRLAQRSYDQFKDAEGDRYKALADDLLAKGEERKASAPAQSEETAPESAPEPEEVPESTPEETSPVEDAPAPSLVEPDDAPEEVDPEFKAAEDRYNAYAEEAQNLRGGDPRRAAWDSAMDNGHQSTREGVERFSKEWYDIVNSSYTSALDDILTERDAEEHRLAREEAEADAEAAGPAGPFGISFERRPDGLDHPVASDPEAMNDEENEEFARQDIALTHAQHENRRGHETIARRKLAELERRVQSRLDSESLKRARDIQNGDSLEEIAPESNESDAPAVEEVPEVASEAPATPEYDQDGLLPNEAARLLALEERLSAAYRGESDESTDPLNREIQELINHGIDRSRGKDVGDFRATQPVPDRNTQETEPEAAPEASPEPEAPEAPAAEAPEAPAPARRTRNSEPIPVADADGNMITRGDKIGHPTLGPVEITNTIPGTGRVEFIDPNTGRKKSVKAARVRKIDPNAAEAPAEEESATAEPGSRFVDRATGKQGFGDSNGNRVLVGDRIRHANGSTGTVKAVYTAASGGAWPAIQWDSDGKVRRAMGNVLEKDDSASPEAAPEAAPEPIEVVRPSATPAPAPERVEPAEEPFEPVLPSATPAPAPAPEAAPAAETFPEQEARTLALVEETPVNGMISNADGSQRFYKVSDSQWQFNEGNLLSPVAVARMLRYGEARGFTFTRGEGRPTVDNTPANAEPAVEVPQAPRGVTLDPNERTRRIGMISTLPTGTKVYPRSGEYTLTKNGENNWSSTVDDGVYNDEDIYGIVESGRAGGLIYAIDRPQPTAPTVLPTVTLDPIPLDPDSLVPPTVASRLDAFRRAPIGTTVTKPDGSVVWTKQATDEWVSPSLPGATIKNTTLAIEADSDNQNGHWVFNKTIPEPKGVNVSAMTATEKLRAFRQAPIGTKLVSTGGKVITKTGERLWKSDAGTAYGPADLVFVTAQTDISGPFGIILPETTTPDAPRPIPQDLGSRIRVSESAPVGTIVTSTSGESYTKISETQWADTATGNFKYGLGEFASKLQNNPYTGDYFVQGFDVPDVTPEAPEAPAGPEGDRPRQVMPADPVGRFNYIQSAPIGATVFHAQGRVLEKKGPNRWEDQSTGEDLTDLDVYTRARSIDGWYATLPPEPEVEPVPAINPDLPVGAFVPSAAGSTSGVKRVGDDKWEMVKDGQPTGRFVNDEAVSVIQELVGTDVDIPVDPRLGEPLGFSATDLKLPGGKTLGQFMEGGGSFSSLTSTQRQAIQAGYDKFIENLNSKLPAGFRAELNNPITFSGNIMSTKVAFYKGNSRLGAATRHFMVSTDDRSGKRVSSVEHAYFTLTDATQGSGVSSVFLNASKQMYRQMGLDRIAIHADISVGGYAWARGGFDFASAGHMTDAISDWEMRMNWNIPRGREEEWREGLRKFNELKARATRENFQNKTHPAAIEFANIGRPDGPTSSTDTWFGKAMMLGSDWYGEFPLNPAGPSATV